MRILAIDPGPAESAWVIYDSDTRTVESKAIEDNERVRIGLPVAALVPDVVAIEMIASYGMPVGREVFQTCVWIGRFLELAGPPKCRLIYRMEVKKCLCHDSRAKDANVRAALADLFGGRACKGTKKNPGPLFGIKEDLWSALAVAITAAECPA